MKNLMVEKHSNSMHTDILYEYHRLSCRSNPWWWFSLPKIPKNSFHPYYKVRTPPIISKCSCLLKSMAFPLKNHLKMGLGDESLDTSHGSTRLCPTVASKLKGGTVILVGSTPIWKHKWRIICYCMQHCISIKFQQNEVIKLNLPRLVRQILLYQCN